MLQDESHNVNNIVRFCAIELLLEGRHSIRDT